MTENKNVQKRVILFTLIADGCIFALLSICFFFGYMNIPLGFLLGSVISILCHLILCLQANIITNPDIGNAKGGITIFCYMLRFLLYGGGLVLAFLLEYFGYKIFAWYTVFIAYMIIKIIILIFYGSYRKDFKNLKKGDTK